MTVISCCVENRLLSVDASSDVVVRREDPGSLYDMKGEIGRYGRSSVYQVK